MSLRFDAQHQIVPGFDKRLSASRWKLLAQLAGANAIAGETHPIEIHYE
jgi:hypothetical protein